MKMASYLFDLDFSNLDSEFSQPKLKYLGETELLAHEVGLEEKTEPLSVVEECSEEILEYLKAGKKEATVLETYITNNYSISCYRRARKSLTQDKKIQTNKDGKRWLVEIVEHLE